MSKLSPELLSRCFEGLTPTIIATCSSDGIPNVTYISQIVCVDDEHIALSRQFLNKTAKNLEENPYACLQFYDPLTFDAYRAELRFDHSETSGALFDAMAARIDVIATHTGMVGIFKLLAADVCELVSVEQTPGFLAPCDESAAALPSRESYALGPLNELKALQLISDRLTRARDLDTLLVTTLASCDELLGFQHGMVLFPDESSERLVALSSRGYGESGVGAEIELGEGLIGLVAKNRRPQRLTGIEVDLRYGRAIRDRVRAAGGAPALLPEIPLPGLAHAQSQLALPMLVGDELIGVMAFETEQERGFVGWHESFLQVLANQVALGIARLREHAEDGVPVDRAHNTQTEPPVVGGAKAREFLFYRNDDCVFVDGEYLVRNVPGKILWKILREHESTQRTQFTNRELRLDPTLGLPPIKDNLESRLILLRKRLLEKCPDVQLQSTQRGRFQLSLACPIKLVERDHG